MSSKNNSKKRANIGVLMRSHRKSRYLFFLMFTGVVIWSFAGCNKETVNLAKMTPEQQFEYAKKIFDKKDYYKAKMQFMLITMSNPGSKVVEKAQFYLAESYYHLKEYITAIEEYKKLIRSLPTSPYVDDASYKIGMCYYKLSPGYALDQEYTVKAITQFQRFLEDYPNSELRPEVEKRLAECRNKLAKKEYKNGELYRKMGYYRAAVISFDNVLKDYYDTKFADDALYWKGECLRKAGKLKEAEKTFNEFLAKYPKDTRVEKVRKKLADIRKQLENRSEKALKDKRNK